MELLVTLASGLEHICFQLDVVSNKIFKNVILLNIMFNNLISYHIKRYICKVQQVDSYMYIFTDIK